MSDVNRAPVLRATTESGDVIDDPSEDALFMMLEDVDAGHGTFLIVETLSDPTGQTYAQTMRSGNGTYVVEYRDGDPTRHYGTVAADMRAAHVLLTGWAFQIPHWRETAVWRRVRV